MNVSRENGINILQKKIAVFKESQQQDVKGDSGDENGFFAFRLIFRCRGQSRSAGKIYQYGKHQNEGELHIP